MESRDGLKKEKELYDVLESFSLLPTVLVAIVIEYCRPASLKGNLLYTFSFPTQIKWPRSMCLNSQYLYITSQANYYYYQIENEQILSQPNSWKLKITGSIYEMELDDNNTLYLLHPWKLIIYNLVQNTRMECALASHVCNMSVDKNVVYLTTGNIYAFYKKETTLHKIITHEYACGVANDKDNLYICDRSMNNILVFDKIQYQMIREFGNQILKKPTSILCYNNFLYISDLERMVVLTITGELFRVIGENTGIGNTSGVGFLPRNFCIVNNRLYILSRNSSVLIFE